MKEFQTGKSYLVNDIGNNVIAVIKKTDCYITISGHYSGRYWIYKSNIFNLGNHIKIPIGNIKVFCFAGKEID